MRPISQRLLIDVPRERVFDLLVDLAIRPSFTDHFMEQFRLQRVESVGIGAAARFRLRESEHWMDTTIGTAEQPHLVREHGHGGRGNQVPVFTVWELAEGASPSGCELTVTFWTEPSSLHQKLRDRRGHRRLRRDWHRALVRLREISEDGQAPERVGIAGEDRLPAFAR